MVKLKLNNRGGRPRVAVLGMLATILAQVLATGPAIASEEAERVRTLTASGEIVPLERLIAVARARKPGTLIEAELQWGSESDLAIYELLMLADDGELWELEFNARTGELLEVEREHD